ncbi:carboxymuconolactone decarboxylase family protein [Halorubellus salinus]|uniref:carboxymuconolactone decarboxylase family protein n=1 Tax=Halorubellus salinus TaxID=755309 RepID=UPI001D08912B|nr:carboxymuconolactone decarboxylase family protein [Halorubellus salinus]
MSTTHDHSKTQELADVKHSLSDLIAEAPEIEQFAGFVEGAEATSVVDHKTKELVSLAIAVVTRCDHCILWHTDAALDAGASHDEIVDVLKVAVVMGGGPALMYAVDAYDTLLALESERAEN